MKDKPSLSAKLYVLLIGAMYLSTGTVLGDVIRATKVLPLGAYIDFVERVPLWTSGFVFGFVIIFWKVNLYREIIHRQNLFFLIGSGIIWFGVFVVFWSMDYKDSHPYQPYWGVAAGTLVLPLTQALILKTSWLRALVSVPCIYGSWLLLGSVLAVNLTQQTHDSLRGGFLFSLLYVSAWQVPYIFFMFCPVPKFLRREK